MNIAPRLENYLNDSTVEYDVVHHAHTENSYDSACSANVASCSVVKAVILRDEFDGKYVVAMVPADHSVKVSRVNSNLNRSLVFADESEAHELFPDCEKGAIPGFGQAYNLELIWDEDLETQSKLYFEAGNHQDLIEIDNEQFKILFEHQPSGDISTPKEYRCYH